MKIEPTLFEREDAQADAEADARADADAQSGRVIGHGAVRRWLASWGSARPLPRPRTGD